MPPRNLKPPQPDAMPGDFPTAPPRGPQLPGADYSYTVELVGAIQNQLGRLTEAVETLKAKAEAQGSTLDGIGKDMHAFKMTARVIGTIIAAALAFGGWVANKAVDAYVQSHQTQQHMQQK